MQTVFERTLQIIRDRRDLLERTARRLLEKETLDAAELQELVAPRPKVTAETVVEVDRERSAARPPVRSDRSG